MNIFEEALELQKKNIPFAMATIVTSEGSTPRSNAKMIVLSDGRFIGTIGGGLVESFIINEGVNCIKKGKSRMVEYTLDHGTGISSIDMDCGGKMEVFIEVVGSRPTLLILGGGHVGLKIAEQGTKLDFSILVADSRQEFSSTERFPMALSCYTGDTIAKAVEKIEIDSNTYVVICTGSEDEEALRAVINSQAAYIGMLGSSRKINRIMENMKSDGFSENLLSTVYAPIGIDFRAETPEEIAFCILSEIKMIQAGTSGKSLKKRNDNLVIVRGGGDIASGSIARLHKSGYQVVVLEIDKPTVIRSAVSFAQAVYDKEITIEGIKGVLAGGVKEARKVLSEGNVPVMVDPKGECIKLLQPVAVVDAILAKKNLGTNKDMAPVVIGVGPGFEAGIDVHLAVETMRGHDLGMVISEGRPIANTGVPGVIGGYAAERVIRGAADGKMEPRKKIGDMVEKGDLVAVTGGVEVKAQISGVIRGMLMEGLEVTPGYKIGDIDPRGVREHCFTISDKARAVGGGVLEALLHLTVARKR